jgi:hypothetical protein
VIALAGAIQLKRGAPFGGVGCDNENSTPDASNGGQPTGAGGNGRGTRAAVDADCVHRPAADGAWRHGGVVAVSAPERVSHAAGAGAAACAKEQPCLRSGGRGAGLSGRHPERGGQALAHRLPAAGSGDSAGARHRGGAEPGDAVALPRDVSPGHERGPRRVAPLGRAAAAERARRATRSTSTRGRCCTRTATRRACGSATPSRGSSPAIGR